jgi:hypothetical protein
MMGSGGLYVKPLLYTSYLMKIVLMISALLLALYIVYHIAKTVDFRRISLAFFAAIYLLSQPANFPLKHVKQQIEVIKISLEIADKIHPGIDLPPQLLSEYILDQLSALFISEKLPTGSSAVAKGQVFAPNSIASAYLNDYRLFIGVTYYLVVSILYPKSSPNISDGRVDVSVISNKGDVSLSTGNHFTPVQSGDTLESTTWAPLVLAFTPQEPGQESFRVDFFYQRHWLTRLTFDFEIMLTSPDIWGDGTVYKENKQNRFSYDITDWC